LKISFRKGFQVYATHLEESAKDKESNIEYYSVLKEYEDVFWEIPGFPPKRNIDFSIDLMCGSSPKSKNPMRTPELKDLQM
jgi:hypothetical protein